jgi:ABC-2 type transport system permease protein
MMASILITAVNSIASSSISREGNSFQYMKVIPLSYKTQIKIKIISSIIVSYIALFLTIIVLSIIYKFGFVNTLLYLLLSFISVVFISTLGVFLDTVNPKLVWDDEINALRGNHNVFINMAFSILISGVLLGIIFLLKYLNIDIVFAYIISFILVISFAITTYFIAMKYGSKNIERIE